MQSSSCRQLEDNVALHVLMSIWINFFKIFIWAGLIIIGKILIYAQNLSSLKNYDENTLIDFTFLILKCHGLCNMSCIKLSCANFFII